MAHFARLDENNIVIDVQVINNSDIVDEDGQESEEVGIAFCESFFNGGRWIQTSYNDRIRKNYAGIGYAYDPIRDAFIPPKPEPWPSLVLDEETCRWVPPIPRPDESYIWNEALVAWEKID